MDYIKHNEEIEQIWSTYKIGKPIRVPMTLGIGAQYNLFNTDINENNVDYTKYCTNVRAMVDIQMRAQYFHRMNTPYDHIMGPFSDDDGYDLHVDFQNYHEAAWLGCPIKYIQGQSPYATHYLDDNNLNSIFDKGIPKPFDNIMGVRKDFYEQMLEISQSLSWQNVGVCSIDMGSLGTDGPFTLACSIRGVEAFCLDLYLRPEYAKKLLRFIALAVINRIKSTRKYLGNDTGFFFADDSIALLSKKTYREFVMPVHRLIADELSDGIIDSIHLCGDATHLFKTIVEEFKTTTFDTGFPIQHSALQQQLGPDVCIQGGPEVSILLNNDIDIIDKRVKTIIESVKPFTKKFILRDANNLSANTPLSSIKSMYQACKKYGIYEYN